MQTPLRSAQTELADAEQELQDTKDKLQDEEGKSMQLQRELNDMIHTCNQLQDTLDKQSAFADQVGEMLGVEVNSDVEQENLLLTLKQKLSDGSTS